MSLNSTIVGKRTLKPILWNLFLQGIFLSTFIFLTRMDLLHPMKWFYDSYFHLVLEGSWLYIIPLALIVIAQGSTSTEDYVKTQPFYPTRVSLVKKAITVHNIVVCFIHIFIGFLIPWVYASLIGEGYDRISCSCKNGSEKCLSEKRLFLIFGGMWTNALYFFYSHFFGTRYLKFPVVQLPKFILIKSYLFETMFTSVKWVIVPNLFFIFTYVMRGGQVSLSIAETFSFEMEENRLDTFSGVFNFPLIAYLLIFSSLIVISMRLMELFYRVYLTERYFFKFHTLPEEDVPTLTDSLNMNEYPIVQHLAFLDLMLFCEHSKSRREEIFKLSSFGGHPHLWNAIKKNCMTMIEEFIQNIEENIKPPAPPKLATIIKTPPKRNVPNYFVDYKTPSLTSANKSVNGQDKIFHSGYSRLVERVNKSRFVIFFFGDRKDMRIRHTLRLSLPVKWSCESLSFLACHSVKEDHYGVIVNDLPDIIRTLLQLKQVLDHLLKQATLAATLTYQDLQNITEAIALKKSVKRSIYRVVNTFKSYINEIRLPKEVESQLIPYICYRE